MMRAAGCLRGLAAWAFLLASVSCNGPSMTPAPPSEPSKPALSPRASTGSTDITPPPATLAALVPPGAMLRTGQALDAHGRFVCQESYTVVPSAEDAGCAMANGHEIQAKVEFLAAPGSAVEVYAVEPLRLWLRTGCGAVRQPLVSPPRALLAKLAPSLTRKPSALKGLSARACTDPRLSVRLSGARHRFVHDTVHRLEPIGDQASVDLLLSGAPLSTWPLFREAQNADCPGDPSPHLPWSLDLEVVCDGNVAVVTSTVWRPAISPSCIASGKALQPPDPPAPPCAPRRGEAIPSFQVRDRERTRVRLDTGATESIKLAPPTLYASVP